jgi:flagellar hook-length control protein FliK
VFSVTSETAANLSLQNAPSRPAKADQSPAPDSFSALIDGNAADSPGNDRAAPAAPDRPSQRPDEPSATSGGKPARDAASSSNAGAEAPSQDSEPSAAQPAATASNADAGAVSKQAKPELAKTGVVKAALKDAVLDIAATTDLAAPADAAASAQAAAPGAAPDAVAAVIAVPVATTDIVAAPGSPPSTTAPLTIAAAAIATSTSTVEASKPLIGAVQGVGDQPKPASAPAIQPAAPSAATPVAPTTDVAVPAATGAINARTTAPDAIATPVNQPAAKADAVVQADPELAAAVAAATPAVAVAPKAMPKTAIAARSSESAPSIKTGLEPGAGDPSSTSPDATSKAVAPQGPAVDGKPKTESGAVDAAKTGPATTDAPATAAPHEHRTLAAQVQTEPPDLNQAANAVQQAQAPSATTPVATQFTVTAATGATAVAVPLNGLALQIAVTAQSGKSRFEIRLDPAELGRIDVRIDVDRHGQLTSHLMVEKPETLAMLRQDAPQLQRALDNAGFKTGDGGLQFSLRDQSSSGQNTGNEAGRNAQRLIISEDDSITASVAGRTYGRMSGLGGGVDIRV